MAVEEKLALPHYEDRDCEMPSRVLFLHWVIIRRLPLDVVRQKASTL